MGSQSQTSKYLNITSQAKLEEFCNVAKNEGVIAFDTEFVSEDTYENHLCLIQVATRQQVAVIDALEISDLRPFWQMITSVSSPVIVHAAREEFCFAYRVTGEKMPHLFDVQVAAGMVGMEYPAAYSTLATKLAGGSLQKHETRTDWRKRPLTKHQIEYALQDVLYLHAIYDHLYQQLAEWERTEWLFQEMERWQTNLLETITGEVWRRLAGTAKLSPRGLAIAREIWNWRDQLAKSKNRPARRFLRDDLIVELAKRGASDPQRIRAIRGMEYRETSQHIDAIAKCIARALKIPLDECPQQIKKQSTPPVNLLAQFLSTALAAICRDASIAPSIVGTSEDIRQWLGYRLWSSGNSKRNREVPLIATGWRAEIIGKRFDELLSGKVSLSVANPNGDQPLVIRSTHK